MEQILMKTFGKMPSTSFKFNLISIIVVLIFTLYCIPRPCDCRTLNSNMTNNSNNYDKSRIQRYSSTNTPKDFDGIESNSIQRIVANNGKSHSLAKLKRVYFQRETNVTCNDGSQAGFYLRKSPGSRRWVVFLEGGWHCYDHKSCRSRWLKMRHLMTSTQWPETRDVGGILSPSASENPFWHNANHVFVPYCSSDSWSGTRAKPEPKDSLRFMGSLIVRQVMADLIPLGLGHSSGADLLMAGSSAGGLGVMLNLDKVKTFLQDERGLNVQVRGVSDSGWFLDREPYTSGAVAASEAVRQGWKLWNGALPEACVAEQKEPWRCYFGHRLYNTLKSPLFVFQWLFDEAQMRADSVGAPVTPQQWDYIHEMGGALRTSLDNVTAVFAPSCIGHSVLTKRDWLNIKIDDISLADAIRCWEQSLVKDRKMMKKIADNKKRKKKQHKNRKEQQDQPELTPEEREQRRKELRKERKKMTPEEREQKRLERRENRRQERLKQRLEAKKNSTTKIPRLERSPRPQGNKMNNKNLMPKIIENEPSQQQQQQQHQRQRQPHHKKRKNQNQNQNLNQDNSNSTKPHHHRRNHQQQKINQKNPNKQKQGESGKNQHNNRHKLLKAQNQLIEIKEPKKCSLRLLERCSWPQCNHSCPTLTNPLTGEEMKFLELLTSFGLDMDAVATALGVDMQTLNNMDHMELVNLFTETSTYNTITNHPPQRLRKHVLNSINPINPVNENPPMSSYQKFL